MHGDWVIEKAASGDLTLKIGGVYVHSSRNPRAEAQKLVESAEKDAKSQSGAAFVLGFGLGYAAEEAAKRFSRVVVVEKNKKTLEFAAKTRDLRDFFAKNVIFVTESEPEAVLDALALVKKAGPVIKNRVLVNMDSRWYGEVLANIEFWQTKEEVNAATLRRFGALWEKNLRANEWAFSALPGVSTLAGTACRPILLLAAGPSLDMLKGRLSFLRKKYLFVAVDTALRFCCQEGVTADFAISCDGQFWNTRHLVRAAYHALLASPEVHPLTLRAAREAGIPAYLCAPTTPCGEEAALRFPPLAEKGVLGAGGSVATTAWDFCCLLLRGTGLPIYAAGLDLAFPNFRTHYKGSLFEELSHQKAGRLCPAQTLSFHALRDGGPFWAEAASGVKVLTDKRLSLYAAWFEKRLAKEAVPTYSLSQEGLAIKGLKPLTLSAFLRAEP